jgi:HupE / UreJ protein
MLPPVAPQEHTAILPDSLRADNRLFSTTAFQSLANPDSMRLRKALRSKNLRFRRLFCGTQVSALGLPATDIPLALVMFNVGVEIGQVSFVLLILLLERSFRQLEIRWPRWIQALPGYTVGSLGAFWTIQRAAILLGIIP